MKKLLLCYLLSIGLVTVVWAGDNDFASFPKTVYTSVQSPVHSGISSAQVASSVRNSIAVNTRPSFMVNTAVNAGTRQAMQTYNRLNSMRISPPKTIYNRPKITSVNSYPSMSQRNAFSSMQQRVGLTNAKMQSNSIRQLPFSTPTRNQQTSSSPQFVVPSENKISRTTQ
ncbi:MAG: hypothetical protein KBA46_03110 [Candidatus Omnitrophica bacterium]|nr:hypothetical protein [Candidatus Omnitrophota bacterium]